MPEMLAAWLIITEQTFRARLLSLSVLFLFQPDRHILKKAQANVSVVLTDLAPVLQCNKSTTAAQWVFTQEKTNKNSNIQLKQGSPKPWAVDHLVPGL